MLLLFFFINFSGNKSTYIKQITKNIQTTENNIYRENKSNDTFIKYEPLATYILINGNKIILDKEKLYSIDRNNNHHVLINNINDVILSIEYIRLLEVNESLLLYNGTEIYLYDFKADTLSKINTPPCNDKKNVNCRVEDGKLFWNDYYFSSIENRFINIKTTIRPKFKGIIHNVYYYPQNEYGNIGTNVEQISIYKTPYIEIMIGNKNFQVYHYYIKDDIEYILDKSNILYKIIDNMPVKLVDIQINNYDIFDNYLIYSNFMPNAKLFCYDLLTNNFVIYDKDVLDIFAHNNKIHFLSGYDYSLYVYNIETKFTKKLTNNVGIVNVEYTNHDIIYEDNNKQINILDIDTYALKDTFEGQDMKFNRHTNDIYYTCGSMLLKYNTDNTRNKVLSHGSAYILDFFNEKVIGDNIMDGPMVISILNGFDSIYTYEVNDYNINNQYAISVAPILYGVCLYTYDRYSLKYHHLVDFYETTTIYYDNNFVYFRRTQDNKWNKYNLKSGKTTIIDDLKIENLNVIKVVPGSA